MNSKLNKLDPNTLVKDILNSRKYRTLGIPEATVLDLIIQVRKQTSDPKEIEKAVKQKMHNLVARYLGDADYASATSQLDQVFANPTQSSIQAACSLIMAGHASTRERLPILNHFYGRIFSETGIPTTILDLACGLNPFALPWMHLPPSTEYHAYDIVQPRVDLINHFLSLMRFARLAENRDVLIDPPEIQADVAFFFKEAHRLEQRQKGSNRSFWQSIPAKMLLVSLPTANLSGNHPKLDQHRRLVYNSLEGLNWPVKEILFENEIVFCIRKSDEA